MEAPLTDIRDWHARSSSEVLQALHSRAEGLSRAQAGERLARHGPNALPVAAARHPVLRLLAQFHSTLIYVLLGAAALAGALGHALDAVVIVTVVLVNAVVGFLQEGKAERALAAIRSLVSPRAHVLRDGQRMTVPVADLIPGDVVLLDAGDRVPADLRLLRARGLLVDEALLTGESVAAQKQELPAPPDAPLGDRHSMAFSGTLVAAGQASGVVVATGERTELGRIGRLIAAADSGTTPLLRQIDHFGRLFAVFVLVASLLLFLYTVLWRGWPAVDALLAVVAIAVSVIPEGLPAIITVTLAVGVQRMAAHNAVIRSLPAVETLGATSVICSDKTGTLTRNEMSAHRVLGPASALRVEGEGYGPEGTLRAEGGDDADAVADVLPLLRCGLLCNDARVVRQQAGHWTVLGDPMEGALLALAARAGLDAAHVRQEWPRVDEIPFDASRRFMATLHCGPDGEAVAFVKGAPERILAMADVAAAQGQRWDAGLQTAAAGGERVLAFAARRLPAGTARLDAQELEHGLAFLGLVGFVDPPREEARQAIAECRAAGIAVKMITGDHAATAVAIARQLQLADAPQALTGAELDALPERELAARVRATQVFARTTPEHKLRIVRALQSEGAVVAMTGDGVNDAPSLKQADVGVAMGIKGTEAAKEAAQMVLLDDDFASIVRAVREGRTVYDNVRKVIAFTLPTNGGEVLGLVICMLAGLTLPMTAAQVLWVNLVTDTALSLALAFEAAEPGLMARPPRAANAPLVSGFMLWRVILVSGFSAAVTLALLQSTLAHGGSIESARTLVINAIVAMEIGYLFSLRVLSRTALTWKAALGTPAVLKAIAALALTQLVITYVPPMNRLFGTAPLTAAQLGLAAAAGAALMLVLEGEKALLRRWRPQLLVATAVAARPPRLTPP
jgi:magnesium-transporting ATPase (P-type)